MEAHAFFKTLCITASSYASQSCNPNAGPAATSTSHRPHRHSEDSGQWAHWESAKLPWLRKRVAKWGPLGTKLGAVGPLSISSYVCQIMDSAHRTVGPLSRPLTSKSVAAVPSKAGHGHCKTADPRNYNCHMWGTPNRCLGNGSSCSGHANAGYCARTDGTPNPLPAIAADVCHRSPYGRNGATAGG